MKITQSSDANELVRKIFPVDINYREAMVVLYLNNSNRTISYGIASVGAITGTLVDIRLILRDALISMATGIILVHNHPSGNLNPSHADKQLTQKIKEAGKLMDIKLLDHLIITENDYYSFMDDGIFNF
ncbi:MAG: JAB domain-containing protein [Flavobacteriaceae bacterium]